MEISRRSMFVAMPLLMAACSATSQAAEAPAGQLLKSVVLPYDTLPVQTHATTASRAILNGLLHNGQQIEVHETTLQPGASPHPPHQHVHEEMFLMVKGQLEVTIAGKTQSIGPGAAAFVASGELHGVRNATAEETQYFVVAFEGK